MHTVFDIWKQSRKLLNCAEDALIAVVRAQFQLENSAFMKVYGVDSVYTISYYRVDPDGRVEAYADGCHGGEDWIVWRREFRPGTDAELSAYFEAKFIKEKAEAEQKKAEQKKAEEKQRKREELLQQLAKLDKSS